ncbi:hypothetical protein BV25DRAFT_1829888 [Artomyces pyxidatus]|uniref:Uncharacterized protein n=1 Tax=Artomyces pyxidatus TaxID=48021 RepID=A0ACB8SQK8_9AGAM|nr:hypothetical protein BV25DRAFT_1829888 [Artomyces pyxidatus]
MTTTHRRETRLPFLSSRQSSREPRAQNSRSPQSRSGRISVRHTTITHITSQSYRSNTGRHSHPHARQLASACSR